MANCASIEMAPAVVVIVSVSWIAHMTQFVTDDAGDFVAVQCGPSWLASGARRAAGAYKTPLDWSGNAGRAAASEVAAQYPPTISLAALDLSAAAGSSVHRGPRRPQRWRACRLDGIGAEKALAHLCRWTPQMTGSDEGVGGNWDENARAAA